MIVVIDYGAGNLRSVSKALDFLKVEHVVSGNREDIVKADKLIFPGVGQFGDAMRSLKEAGAIKEAIAKGIPFLGICLGMQLLLEKSEEAEEAGMGIIKGIVKKLNTGLKVPQIGWNSVKNNGSGLFEGIKDNSYFYFVHSYYAVPEEDVVTGRTEYGIEFASAIQKDNVYAVQFHPEKSGDIGLKMLKNFAEKC